MATLAPWLMPVIAAKKPCSRAGSAYSASNERLAAVSDFVLRLSGAKSRRQIAPEAIQAGVGHLQDAANVRGLALVEEQFGGRRVAVLAVSALQKAERHQSVQKISRTAGMQTEPALQVFRIARLLGQFGKQSQLDCAQ